jgi:15-cis-phytoene synthase
MASRDGGASGSADPTAMPADARVVSLIASYPLLQQRRDTTLPPSGRRWLTIRLARAPTRHALPCCRRDTGLVWSVTGGRAGPQGERRAELATSDVARFDIDQQIALELEGVLNREAQDVIDTVARSFSAASRLLPRAVRSDVNLLYLAVRTLDDLVDGEDPSAGTRLDEVERWVATGRVTCREAAILDRLAARHPALPRDAVAEFCEGQRRDLHPRPFRTEQELDEYCYRVAGTVGRMMAAMLGARHTDADAAARALGIAMQRTNILRDVDEDLGSGRVYLPEETLHLAGVGDLSRDDRSLALRVEVAIAEWWYERGLAGIVHLPQGRLAVRTAATMYREILAQVGRDGWGRRRPWRPVVSGRRRAWLFAWSLVR